MMEQQTATAPQELKVPGSVKNLIEGLIFAADEPLTVRQIKAIYEQQTPGGEGRHLEQADVQKAVDELNAEFQQADKAYRIVAIAGGYQFATMKEYAEWLGRLYKEQSRRKLSQSSLESLAIIAYRQPISKPEIESIRGVNCDYVLKTLLEKELVTITGRAETVGRPLLYGTTREFLRHFGLNEVTDLPRPREIEEILGESEFETERRMLEAQAGADMMKKEEEEFKSRLPHIPKKKSEMDEAVQIVPREKARKINMRESVPDNEDRKDVDESPAVEPVVNEITPATFEEGATADPVDTAPETIAESTGPMLVTPYVQKETDRDVEDIEPTPESSHAKERGPEITQVVEPETVDEIDEVKEIPEVPVANEEQSPEVEESNAELIVPPQEPEPEPEMSQPRRSRWTTWKEKVQTFIKNLFG